AAGAAAQDRNHQTDLRVSGQPESRPRPLRCAARADLWRGGRCNDADPAHAGGVHGGRSWLQERHDNTESATHAPARCAAHIGTAPYPLQSKSAGRWPALLLWAMAWESLVVS